MALLPVYYSVSPYGTGDLKTGTPSISVDGSGVATLTEAQTGNIGIGDKVVYNSITSFIAKVNSPTSFDLVTRLGVAASTQSSTTLTSINHCFASLSLAESGSSGSSYLGSGSLTTLDVVCNWCCYYDHSTHAADGEVLVETWTCDATRYLKIYVPKGGTESINNQRHSGKWDDNKFKMEADPAAYAVIGVEDLSYLHVDGVQIYLTNTATTNKNGIDAVDSGGAFTVVDCIIKGSTSNTANHKGIYVSTGAVAYDHYVWNCVVYDFIGNSSCSGIQHNFSTNAACHLHVYNSTVYNCYSGYSKPSTSGTMTITNSVAFNCTDDFGTSGGGTLTISYCASDDADGSSAVGLNENASSEWTNAFTDYANYDFSLKSGGLLTGAGSLDPSGGLYYTDITGKRRYLVWDIGAFEYIPSADSGTIVTSGKDVDLRKTAGDKTLTADSKIITLSGSVSNIAKWSKIDSLSGSIKLSGSDSVLNKTSDKRVTADSKILTLSGSDSYLHMASKRIIADSKTLTLSGAVADLSKVVTGNDFSSDSNIMAVYKFDNDVTDFKGSSELTNYGLTFSSSTRKEGSYSAQGNGSSYYAEVANSGLDSGFPGKNGESFTALSVTVWVRFTTLNATSQVLAGVWNATDLMRCWVLKILCPSASSSCFEFLKGYNAGVSWETFDHDYNPLSTGVWYHGQLSYLESSGEGKIGVWDDTYAGYRQVGGSDFETYSFTQATNVEDEEFNVGRYGQSLYYLNGYIDELVIAKDVLTASEFNQIRAGTYTGTVDKTLTADSKTITLSGSASSLINSFKAIAESKIITLSGSASVFKRDSRVISNTGVTKISGTDATTTKTGAKILDSQTGVIRLSGSVSSLRKDSKLVASSKTLILSGSASALRRDQKIIANSKTLTLSGTVSDFRKSYRTIADTSHFHLTGTDASLDKGSPVVTLDSSFECGNGIEDSPFQYGSTFNIVTECDPAPGDSSWGDWFYFKLTGVNSMTPTIKIDFTNNRGGGPLYTGYSALRPVWSYDQVTWTRLSSITSYTSNILTFNLPTMSQNAVYVAMEVPYSYTDLQTDYATWSASSYVSASILSYGGISTSQGGRNIYYLKIEEPGYYNNRLEIVVTGRTHPDEILGSWHVKGMIDWLLSADATAIQYRRKCVFYFFPMVNVDGVYAGRVRSYNDGSDANRNFDCVAGPSSSTEPYETFLVHSKIDEINSNVTICIDSHGNNYASPRWVYDSVNDDWTSGELSAITTDLGTYDTTNYWYNGVYDMITEYTTGFRNGQIQQYGYHALGIEGGFFAIANGGYASASERVTAGGVIIKALIYTFGNAAGYITASSKTLTLSGKDANLGVGLKVVDGSTGVVKLSGLAPALKKGSLIDSESSILIFNGSDTNLVKTAISFTQEGFRFRRDDGTETTATWLIEQDTSVMFPSEDNIRLRMLIDATADPAEGEFKLQYRYAPQGESFGGWTTVPLG